MIDHRNEDKCFGRMTSICSRRITPSNRSGRRLLTRRRVPSRKSPCGSTSRWWRTAGGFLIMTRLIIPFSTSCNASRVDPAEYAARRDRLARAIGPNGMLVVLSTSRHPQRGHSTMRSGRTIPSLFDGNSQPETSLVLLPSETQFRETRLFFKGIQIRSSGPESGIPRRSERRHGGGQCLPSR